MPSLSWSAKSIKPTHKPNTPRPIYSKSTKSSKIYKKANGVGTNSTIPDLTDDGYTLTPSSSPSDWDADTHTPSLLPTA
jgi:uncharacterized lipoprotein YddW (UPF0748 family)